MNKKSNGKEKRHLRVHLAIGDRVAMLGKSFNAIVRDIKPHAPDEMQIYARWPGVRGLAWSHESHWKRRAKIK